MTFQTIHKSVMDKWHAVANNAGIPEESYSHNLTKIVSDPAGQSQYTFGVTLNEYRGKRPGKRSKEQTVRCHLCRIARTAQDEEARNLFSEVAVYDHIISPNEFPPTEGSALAISQGVNSSERPMYTTNSLKGLEDELEALFDFSQKTGYHIFHNGPGAGATIPNHEHWQLTNWEALYNLAGETYGFDKARIEQTKVSTVSFMPDFPFAHLIFDTDEPDRIVDFLRRLGKGASVLEDGSVPHVLCQGKNGVLVVPFYKEVLRDLGSGDAAGHIVIYSREDFEKADYDFCVNHLSTGIFRKEQLNMENFL